VSAGGYLIILPGATDTAPTGTGAVVSTGVVLVLPTGVTSATNASGTVSAGGTEYVLNGGTASGTVVSSGGTQNVYSGGVASSTTVLSGGIEYVLSGGTASGTVISAGGTEILQTGATQAGSINFAGGNGTLSIGGTTLPASVISGFDAGGITTDSIVLTGFSYTTADTITMGAGNTLALVLNGSSYSLNFDPSQSFAGDYFELGSNSLGQVVIIDPTVFSTTPAMDFLRPGAAATSGGPGTASMRTLADLFTSGSDASSFAAGFLPISASMYSQAAVNTISASASPVGGGAYDMLQTSLQHGTQIPILPHSG
jgi:autotransporter passenger strand-loop-strand repeat protein